MRSAFFLAGALALGANAHTYPDCEHDNCYRNIIDVRFVADSKPLCKAFLASTVTAPAAIPTQWENCEGVEKVSSACSCITYESTTSSSESSSTLPPSTSTSSTSSTEVPSTTLTTTPTTKPTSTTTSESCTDESSSSTSKTSKWTTSTISVTKTFTVTSCKPEVTDCPGKPHVTTTVIIETTVCPVEDETTKPTYKPTTKPSPPTTKGPTGTGYPPQPTKTTSTSTKAVTAAAGRVASGLEMAAAAAVGALAFL